MLTKLYTIFYLPNPDSCYGLNRANEFKNNRALYETKVKYFTKKYANVMNTVKCDGYGKTWDFSYNERDELNINKNQNNDEYKIISNNNNYLYNDNIININNNYNDKKFNVYFIYNGKEKITLQCSKNELVKDLIDRFKKKLNIEDNNHFFIYNCKRFDSEFNAYIGETYLYNNPTIDVINTYDIIYA